MPQRKTSREELLSRAWSVIHERGYYHTSMRDLRQATGLGNAGLLHHFGSKEGLMRAVIEFAAAWYRENVLSLLRGPGLPSDRLSHFFGRHFKLVRKNGSGCFFANTISETGNGELFTDSLITFHEDWMKAFTGFIQDSTDRGAEAHRLAYECFADYQGAVLLFKLYQDEDHLEAFRLRCFEKIGISHPIATNEQP